MGSIKATRNAWDRNNFLTFEIHGTLDSIYFDYEKRDELQVCFANDPDDRRGFKTVFTGPSHPYGEGNTVGTDYMTVTVHGSGNVKIEKFEQIKSYELPPNYENIKKKGFKNPIP